MNAGNRAPIIQNILTTIERYTASVVGVSDAVVRARYIAVRDAVQTLAVGNEDSVQHGDTEEIIAGLGAPERGVVLDLLLPPSPSPDPPKVRTTAEMLPVVEAMLGAGLFDPAWATAEGVDVEVVERSWWNQAGVSVA